MNDTQTTSRLGRGIMYFCIGLAIGGIFYLIITSGWRASLQESRWLVQRQWAQNERDWLALDEIGRRLVQRRPRQPEGWDALISSAVARNDYAQARKFLDWVRKGLPANEELWSDWEKTLATENWQPSPILETDALPTLGEPLVRAKANLINHGAQGCVLLTFDKPVFSFLAARAASYVCQTTGRIIFARLAEPDPNPHVEKFQLTFCPAAPLAAGTPYRFVFDMPQQRAGGAWLPYPIVVEIPPPTAPSDK
jgi:hypothetical protein